MHDIWYEHGIDEDCCVGIRGNVDGDPEENMDIADISYLTAYAFNHGPAPPCMLEADVNGSGGQPDVTDITWLVTFAFRHGPPPPSCP